MSLPGGGCIYFLLATPTSSAAEKPLGRAGPPAGVVEGRWPRTRLHLLGQAGAARLRHRDVIHLEFAWKFPLSPSSSSLEPGSISSCDMHFFPEGEANRW